MFDKTVLIVDDEEDIRIPTAKFLKKELKNVEILTASDGEEAFEIIKHNKIDLVISDIRMPKLDGFELLLKIRKYSPESTVIMITAYGNPTSKEKANNMGAISYIEKPFELKELLKKIQDILNFDRGFVGNVAQLDLTDIIQMICLGKKNLTIEITNENQKGYIYVIEGEIIDSRLGNKHGTKAFYDILSWQNGNFQFLPAVSNVTTTINMRWENLLMEGMKYIDEMKEKTENSQIPENIDTKKLIFWLDEAKKKIEDINAIGFFNIETGKLIIGESIEDETISLQKVDEYSKMLKNISGILINLEKEQAGEMIFTFSDKIIYFIFIDNKTVWGIEIDNADILGRLKTVINKLTK